MSAPQTILLLHGFPLDSGMWTPQRSALEGLGYRVLTPDLPGFGRRKPWPRENCSMESFADDIHRLLRADTGGSAAVGGFSMGGYVLLALLRRHPEVVTAVMLMDTHAAADTPQVRENRRNMIRAVPESGVKPVADAMVPRLLSSTAPAELRRHVFAMICSQNPAGIVNAQEAMARRGDHTDLLRQLRVPALVVVGQEDVLTPPATARAMCDQIPAGRLVEIPGAGHLANLEAPQAVNAAIVEFLRAL